MMLYDPIKILQRYKFFLQLLLIYGVFFQKHGVFFQKDGILFDE